MRHYIPIIIGISLCYPIVLKSEEFHHAQFPKALIIYETSPYPFQKAIAEESIQKIYQTFNSLGRFFPVESNELTAAQKKLHLEQINEKTLHDFATACGTDIYVFLSFSQNAKTHIVDIKIRALRDEWKFIEKSLRIQTKIPQNIPALLSKEIAFSHKNVPILAKVLEIDNNGFARISAGEWHGIRVSYYKTNKGIIRIIQTAKYESLIKSENFQKDEILTLNVYPNVSPIVNELDEIIQENTIKTYAISEKQLRHDNDELRFMSATCLVNPGGSFCLGGYGAFLSTYYLGFRNPSPSIVGIAISSFSYATQLFFIPITTAFQSNFFPWIRDSDKTKQYQQLHIFLWATIPFTFSAALLDQLAYQCHQSEVLPSFFLYQNNAAAFLSMLIPGGGHFYKGYHYTGWSYFFAEMAFGSYCAYYWGNENKRKCSLIAFAALKAIDILHAYFVTPSYVFFTSEIASANNKIFIYVNTSISDILPNEVCYWIELKKWF